MQGEGKHFLLRICILGVIQTSAGTWLYNKFIYFEVTWGRALRELTDISNNTWKKRKMRFPLKQNADVNLHVLSKRDSLVTLASFLRNSVANMKDDPVCSIEKLLVILF